MTTIELNQRKAEVVKTIITQINDEETLSQIEKSIQSLIDQVPPCQYTTEELRLRGRQAIEGIRQGKGTPHEQVQRKTLPTE